MTMMIVFFVASSSSSTSGSSVETKRRKQQNNQQQQQLGSIPATWIFGKKGQTKIFNKQKCHHEDAKYKRQLKCKYIQNLSIYLPTFFVFFPENTE